MAIGPPTSLTVRKAAGKRRAGAVTTAVPETHSGRGASRGSRYAPAEACATGLLKSSSSAGSNSNVPLSAPASRPNAASPQATAASGMFPHGQSTSGSENSTVIPSASLLQPSKIRTAIPPVPIISFPATTVKVPSPGQLSCGFCNCGSWLPGGWRDNGRRFPCVCCRKTPQSCRPIAPKAEVLAKYPIPAMARSSADFHLPYWGILYISRETTSARIQLGKHCINDPGGGS
jgi:hypothetical protein